VSENNNINKVNIDAVEIPQSNYMIDDIPTEETHPWHRYFARGYDLLISGLLIPLLLLPAFILAANMGFNVNYLVIGFLSLFIYIFIEAGLIALFGTTLGKWAFGITILTIEGKKLTYLQGLRRSFGVWIKGLGLGLPIVALITQLASYSKLTDFGITSWDKKGGFEVHHKGISKLRAGVLIVLYFVLYFGVMTLEHFL
jgi:uncharacterized RDD family membrane protein YckC